MRRRAIECPVRVLATLGLLALGASATACTLDAGHGFATMVEGELHAQFVPGRARDLGEGAFLTDQGYRVRLRVARLHATQLQLLELRGQTGSAGSASFDPANPPPGFTLCHGGHCHADDGSLPTYEEVQAMLAGAEARFEPLVTMPIDRELDLLGGERVVLDDFAPSAELPRGSIDRAEIEVTHLRLEGQLEGGDLQNPVDLVIDLPLTEPIAETLSARIDRKGPGRIALEAALRFDATMLDRLDLAQLAQDGSLAVEANNSPVAEALTEWLVRADVAIEL